MLKISKKYNCLPAKLFTLFSDEDSLESWYIADEFRVVLVSVNFKLGGNWEMIFRSPKGEFFDQRGRYIEIIKNKKIVYTNELDRGERNNLKHYDSTIVTVHFNEESHETELVIEQTTFDLPASLERSKHNWLQRMENLEKLI